MGESKFRKGRTAVLSIERTTKDDHVVIGQAQKIGFAEAFKKRFTLLGLKRGDVGKVKVTIERIE